MRFFLTFPLLFALLSGAVYADPSLDIASRLAREGAPQLALVRVERDQPNQIDALLWPQWEALHLSLLVELNRDQEALLRAELLPPEVPAESSTLYLPAALAALRLNDPSLARSFLAKCLWRGKPDDKQLKDAQLLVIRSYLTQHRPDMAYLAMLRFQQDYQPLKAAEVAQFVENLLAEGGVAEAGNWLAQLDDADPLKLLLRLQAGLILPEAAIVTAKAALYPPVPPAPPVPAKGRKDGGKKSLTPPPKPSGKALAAYWAVIAQAAEQQKDAAAQAEALERQLNLPSLPKQGVFGANAESLRRIYAQLALMAANQAQLLVGEEAAWIDFAGQTAITSPLKARALFSYLAAGNVSREVRTIAETRLASLLLESNLEFAAMRLFSDDAHFPSANPSVRAALGDVALRNRDYPLAAKCWRGMDAPPTTVEPVEWHLKRARAFALGNMPEEAVGAVQRIYAAGLPLEQKATAAILQIAYELEGRRDKGAEALLQQLATLSDSAYWGEIYTALGRIAEERQEHTLAAENYLQAAQWSEGTKARRQAADCLVRAGLLEDARRQYALLLKAAATPAERESLKQALSRL